MRKSINIHSPRSLRFRSGALVLALTLALLPGPILAQQSGGNSAPIGATGGIGACAGDINAACSQVTGGSHLGANTVPNSALQGTVPRRIDLQTGNPLTPVVNTVTKTTLETFTLNGGTLGATSHMHCFYYGDLLNNSGGAIIYTWEWDLGSVALSNHTGQVSIATSASIRQWTITIDLFTNGAQNAESINWHQNIGTAAGNTGDVQAPSFPALDGGYSQATVDTSTNQTVALKVTMGTASASANVNLYDGECSVVQ